MRFFRATTFPPMIGQEQRDDIERQVRRRIAAEVVKQVEAANGRAVVSIERHFYDPRNYPRDRPRIVGTPVDLFEVVIVAEVEPVREFREYCYATPTDYRPMPVIPPPSAFDRLAAFLRKVGAGHPYDGPRG